MTRHLEPSFTLPGLILAWAATAAPAWACPLPNSGHACEGLATDDICGYESSAVWMYHVTVNGDTAGATITVVGGYDAGYDYSTWGTDTAGSLSCCSVAGTALTTVAVQGGTDACSAETTQTCESTLSTKPAVCP